jgi:hypothetical protein
MRQELSSLINRQTWRAVNLTPGKQATRCDRLYKAKKNDTDLYIASRVSWWQKHFARNQERLLWHLRAWWGPVYWRSSTYFIFWQRKQGRLYDEAHSTTKTCFESGYDKLYTHLYRQHLKVWCSLLPGRDHMSPMPYQSFRNLTVQNLTVQTQLEDTARWLAK